MQKTINHTNDDGYRERFCSYCGTTWFDNKEDFFKHITECEPEYMDRTYGKEKK